MMTQIKAYALLVVFLFAQAGYALAAEVTVPADVRSHTLILDPQANAPAACDASREGQLYYNGTAFQIYYCDGGPQWIIFGGADRSVATQVVAAFNTAGGSNRAQHFCDGTDDQQTIQQAFTALGATNGAVYLLEGTYNISGPINLNNPHQAFIGTGRGTVLKITGGSNVLNATNTNGLLISQLMIDGNNSGAGNRGISFNNVNSSKIDKVWIENISGSGIEFNSSSGNVISRSSIVNSSNEAVLLSSSNDNVISYNHLQGNRDFGIRLSSSGNNIVSQNSLANNGSGIKLMDNSCAHNTIAANNIVGSTEHGIYLLTNPAYNQISRNNIKGSVHYGIFLSQSSNNTISSNSIEESGEKGINLVLSSSNSITSNVLDDNGLDTNNEGIKLEDASSNLISTNRIFDSAGSGYGINISNNGCSYNYLVGNYINGDGYVNLSGPTPYDRRIQDLGIETQYTSTQKLNLEPRSIPLDINQNGTIQPGINTYIPLNPQSPQTTLSAVNSIADGKSAGDLLILENVNNNNTITIGDSANTRLRGGTPNDHKTLSRNDILVLIWNGNDWVETGYSDVSN